MSAQKSRTVVANETKSHRRSLKQQVQIENLPADEAKQEGVKGGGHDICTCKVCFPEDAAAQSRGTIGR